MTETKTTPTPSAPNYTPGGDKIIIGKDAVYMAAGLVLIVLLVASIFTGGFASVLGKTTTNMSEVTSNSKSLSDTDLKTKVEAYVTANLLSSDYTAAATTVEPYNDYMKIVNINIMSGGSVLQNAPVFVTPDGSTIIVGQAFKTNEPVNKTTDDTTNTPTTPQQVVKADKPKAAAFIMSFCPYGLQFLKAYVPVMELLGDKADLQVGFVSYMMHGAKELDGNNLIYCVQKNNKANLTQYLRCAVEAGDYAGCVKKVGLDENTITACVTDLDKQYNLTALFNDKSTYLSGYYPLYPVQEDLNLQYGVQGSPSFVLNGQEVSADRSPEAIKKLICSSFNNPPAECNTVLSTAGEAAGVGAIGAGSGAANTAASCE